MSSLSLIEQVNKFFYFYDWQNISCGNIFCSFNFDEELNGKSQYGCINNQKAQKVSSGI